MRIAVCRPQVPFAHGGVEIFTDQLVDRAPRAGHEAEIVSVPFKWYPGTRVLTQAFLWRLLDLTETDGRPIDMVVATKFPSYPSATPRSACGSCTSSGRRTSSTAPSRGIRRDRPRIARCAGRCRSSTASRSARRSRLFATSRNVAGRLERSTGLDAEVLPHPAQALDYHDDGHGEFILSVNRLDRAKRIDLLIEAAALEPALQVVVAGDGPDRRRLRGARRERGVDGRVRFTGRVDASELADLYATCFASYYAPVDEDFGLGPYESFLSGKPVDHRDRRRRAARGRPRRHHGARRRAGGGRGAAAAVWLRDHPERGGAFGRAGKVIAAEVTWDRAIGRLLS